MIKFTTSSVTLGQSERDASAAFDRNRRDANFFRLFERQIPATRALLIAIVAVFLLGFLIDYAVVRPRFGALDDGMDPSILLGAKLNGAIEQGALWRIVSNTFLHGGFVHLAFNLYGLYLLGNISERLFGSRRFIVIYGASALAGAAASYAFNSAPSVGASGAIFGLLGATIIFGVKHRDLIPQRLARDLSTGMLPWLLLSLAIGLTPMRIDNAAHLGGLAAGLLAALGMSSPLSTRHRPWAWRGLGLFAALLLIVAVISAILFVNHTVQCVGDAESWQRCLQEWPTSAS